MSELLKLLAVPEQANVVMETLASYVIYIYPGIISIYWFNFLSARTTKNTQAFLVKSFAISYLYNMCLKAILDRMTVLEAKPDEKNVSYNVILILVSFVLPYIWNRVKLSKLSSMICDWLNISTSIVNIPFELLGDEGEKYTCLKVYLKESPYIYIGYLGEYEYEDEHEKYLILTGYRKYYAESDLTEKEIVTFDAEDYKEKVLIKYGDIRIIEKLEEKRAKKLYMAKECEPSNPTALAICLQNPRKRHRIHRISRKTIPLVVRKITYPPKM